MVMSDVLALQDLITTLPSTKSRLLIDMVNSLEVSRDHLRVQELRDDRFFARAYDSFSGAGRKRQTQIAKQQQLALDSVIAVVNDLAKSITGSNLAITQAARRINSLENNLAQVANHAAHTSAVLRELGEHMEWHVRRVDATLAQLDMRASAKEELDRVISDWQVGRYDAFPLAARAYVALHELYWGSFGEFCRCHQGDSAAQNLLRTLENEVIKQLRDTLGNGRHDLAGWLAAPLTLPLHADALRYLGQETGANRQGLSYVCTHWPLAAEDLPLTVPRLCDAARLGRMLHREFFPTLPGGTLA